MRISLPIGLILLLTTIVAVAAPSKVTAADAAALTPEAVHLTRPVDFEKDIAPILEANCLACHNAGIAESKLNVETADAIRKGGKRGPAVVPKHPESSRLLQVATRSQQPAMPPLPNKVEANALTPHQLGLLKQWILEGARGGAGGGGDAVQWQPIPAGMKSIFAVAVSPMGGRFVAAGRVNQIFVYDVTTGREADRLVDPMLNDLQLDGRPMYPGGAADRDFIHSLAISPDGSLLAAGGYRVVKLWKRPHDVQLQNVKLADAPTALAVSPNGSFVATAAADHSIVLRNAKGAELRKLAGFTGKVTALAFSPDSQTVYGASVDRSWRSWNVADGAPGNNVPTSTPLSSLALNKDGSQVFAGGEDGILRVWSSKPIAAQRTGPQPKSVREWKAHDKTITAIAVELPGGGKLVSGSTDGTVRVWDIAAGKLLSKLDQGAPVTAVAVRPGGEILASAGRNGTTRLWKLNGGAAIATMKGSQTANRRVDERGDDRTIARQHIAAAEARIKTAEQEVKERHEGLKKAAEAVTAAQKALAEFATKEKTAANTVATAKRAAQAKPKDANLKKKLDDAEKAFGSLEQAKKNSATAAASAVRAHEATQKAVAVAEARLKETKAHKAATEATEKAVEQALSAATAEAAKRQFPVRSIAFSSDGSILAVAGNDPEIQLYDAQTGRPLETLSGHTAAVTQVVFQNKATLVSAGEDKTVVAWETNPRWKFVGRLGPKSDASLDLGSSAFIGRVLCLGFNHDGTLLATGGGEPSRSGELKTWKVASLSLDRDFKDAHSDTVFGVDFSRDGQYLASCGADKFVKVFDVKTGKPVRSFEGHTHQVLGVSWKADESLLASAGADNQIKVWNFESGEQQRTITNHTKQVTSIQFLGTGFDILSASGDKTVRLHHATDGDNFKTLEGATDYVYSAAATPDETLVVGGGEDGVLRLWNGKTGKILMSFPPPQPGKEAAQANAARH